MKPPSFWLRQGLLWGGSILAALALQSGHIPAAWFFGPLAVSAALAVAAGHSIQLPRQGYLLAQATIGTALGAGFSAATLLSLPAHFLLFGFAVSFILGTSLLNGWILTRWTRLDAATAFLGTMPGGAGEMAAMSDSLRADTRLVVVMQYTRLLLILGSLMGIAPLLAHLAHPGGLSGAIPSPSPLSVPVFGWKEAALLACLTVAGYLAGTRTPIPAGTFLVPALLHLLLVLGGVTPGRWPAPIFAAAYLVMGLQIGARFHPSTLAAIRDILLPVCGTTLILLLGSLALAWALVREMGLDGMSAYLAATPGGLDSVAAVATELKGDTAIILTVHLVRLLSVLLFGPWLVRACSVWFKKETG